MNCCRSSRWLAVRSLQRRCAVRPARQTTTHGPSTCRMTRSSASRPVTEPGKRQVDREGHRGSAASRVGGVSTQVRGARRRGVGQADRPGRCLGALGFAPPLASRSSHGRHRSLHDGTAANPQFRFRRSGAPGPGEPAAPWILFDTSKRRERLGWPSDNPNGRAIWQGPSTPNARCQRQGPVQARRMPCPARRWTKKERSSPRSCFLGQPWVEQRLGDRPHIGQY